MKIYTKEEIEDITFENKPNITLFYKDTNAVAIESGEKWYKRIWNFLTNPFTYLFSGKLRY